MPDEIETLRSDHSNMELLVRLRNVRMLGLINPVVADIELVVDTLDYLTHFPNVSHHPLEDRIVDQLRAKEVLPFGFATDLEARQGTDLMRDPESVDRDEGLEELILFPTAPRHLDADDWRAIREASPKRVQAPLFHSQVDKRFRQPHQAIVDTILYISALAAPLTVNTMTEPTLKAFADHGELGAAVPADGGDCEAVLADFARVSVNVDALAVRLQGEEVTSFIKNLSVNSG